MLAKRLSQHGLAVSGAVLATALCQNAASACVPGPLVVSTVQAATLMAAGKALATGAISAKVVALTEGVLKAMLLTKIKVAITVVLARKSYRCRRGSGLLPDGGERATGPGTTAYGPETAAPSKGGCNDTAGHRSLGRSGRWDRVPADHAATLRYWPGDFRCD